MISGILNVNKELGISSNKCVSLVKKALDTKKVGHTGTLDLEASGVLPIVIGKATRVSDFLMDEKKEYITEAVFGFRTDTLDWSGQVVYKSEKTFSKDMLLTAMESFTGEITQIPPMYSAIKINGQKMYDLARKGIEVNRKTRKVTIYDFKLIDFEFPKATFKIACSKGTYIRTLIDDLGETLATYAYVSKLSRTKVGDFSIDESINSSDLLDMQREEIISKLKPVDFVLKGYEKLRLDKSYFKQATNGITMRVDDFYSDDLVRVYVDDEFIGLGKNFKNDDQYFLEKVFYDK